MIGPRRVLSATLLGGTLLASGAILAGILLQVDSIVVLGFVLLLLTPAAGVAGAAVAFGRRHETRYLLISAVAFALLLGALVAAAVLAPQTGG